MEKWRNLKKWQKFLSVLFISFIVLFGISIVWGKTYPYAVENVQKNVTVRNEIERAISVKGLNNEVVYTGEIVGGGLFFYLQGETVGTGMGAPVVQAKNLEQFLYLVPSNERIFTSLIQPMQPKNASGTIMTPIVDQYAVKKVYWAFIENRAGIIVYEDAYSYSSDSQTCWTVQAFNEQTITFHSTYEKNSWTGSGLAILWTAWILAIMISVFILSS